MQIMLIFLLVAIFCLAMRGSADTPSDRKTNRQSREDRRELDQLSARVNVLEQVILDRDRRLRDDFRGL